MGRFLGFVASLLLGGLCGLLIGHWPMACLGVFLSACGIYLVDIVRSQRLLHWLSGKNTESLSSGIWGQATDKVLRQYKEYDRQIAHHQNRLSEFLSAIQASPNGVVLLDSDAKIEWVNQTAGQHLGLDLSRDLLQTLTNLLRDPLFGAYFQGGDYSHDVVVPGRDNKPERPCLISVRIHPYGEGKKLLLTRDITALAQAETMRRDFVANVSHEIRTPLTVIAGFLETLQSVPMDKTDTDKYLSLMLTQSSRMKVLVDDLLILSRLEGSPLPGMENAVSLPLFWQSCELEARALSASLHASEVQHLDFQFDTVLANQMLVCSSSEMQSAWSNLLSNAIRYTPAGGRITARASADEFGGLIFSVKDTGPGIAPEHIPRLTERFYRVDRSRSRDSGGTGLGLAIVKHVVQRHGGSLGIESQPSVGSTFNLYLPSGRMQAMKA